MNFKYVLVYITLINLSASEFISNQFEMYEVVPDVIPRAPSKLALVLYPSGVAVNGRNVLTPTLVKDEPLVSWDACRAFYTITMIDPDATSRANPDLAQLLHWLVGNVPRNYVMGGETLAEYIGAAPPLGSGLHRYVILVYKQPHQISFDEPRIPNNTAKNRTKFSIVNFANKYNLGTPVAGNFFQAEYDDYVPVLQNRLGI